MWLEHVRTPFSCTNPMEKRGTQDQVMHYMPLFIHQLQGPSFVYLPSTCGAGNSSLVGSKFCTGDSRSTVTFNILNQACQAANCHKKMLKMGNWIVTNCFIPGWTSKTSNAACFVHFLPYLSSQIIWGEVQAASYIAIITSLPQIARWWDPRFKHTYGICSTGFLLTLICIDLLL